MRAKFHLTAGQMSSIFCMLVCKPKFQTYGRLYISWTVNFDQFRIKRNHLPCFLKNIANMSYFSHALTFHTPSGGRQWNVCKKLNTAREESILYAFLGLRLQTNFALISRIKFHAKLNSKQKTLCTYWVVGPLNNLRA